MNNSKFFAALSLAAFAALAAGPIHAQTSTASSTSAAIAHNAPTGTTGTTQKTPRPAGSVWVKGQVIHVDNVEIVFSEIGDTRRVHTFTYTTDLKPKMQQIVNNTAYKYGDQVRILYTPETTVALKIHLKHTKTTS
jgi:hypothetical protein